MYNDNGTLKKTKRAISHTPSTGKVSYAIAEFDEQGYPIRITNEFEYDVWDYQYHYAADGTMVSVEIFHRKTKSAEVDGSIVIDLSEYDINELRPTESLRYPLFWVVSEDGLKKTSYKVYDDAFDGIVLNIVNIYEYDTHGNLTTEIWFDNWGRENLHYNYENSYDEMGNLVQAKRQSAGSDVVVAYNYIYGYIYAPDAK